MSKHPIWVSESVYRELRRRVDASGGTMNDAVEEALFDETRPLSTDALAGLLQRLSALRGVRFIIGDEDAV